MSGFGYTLLICSEAVDIFARYPIKESPASLLIRGAQSRLKSVNSGEITRPQQSVVADHRVSTGDRQCFTPLIVVEANIEGRQAGATERGTGRTGNE